MQARAAVAYLAGRGYGGLTPDLLAAVQTASALFLPDAPAGSRPGTRSAAAAAERAAAEQALWPALSTLAAAAAPVSLETLVAMDPFAGVRRRPFFIRPREPWSRFMVTVRRYQTGAMALFLLLALTQIYWFACFYTEDILTRSGLTPQPLPDGVVPLPSGVMEYVSGLLGAGGQAWGWLFPYAGGCLAAPADAAPATVLTCLWWRLHQVSGLIGLFLLPGLYGLFGAVVLVIRRLLAVSEAMTYTALNPVRYRLRVLLGGVVGFLIPLFVSSDAALGLLSSLLGPVHSQVADDNGLVDHAALWGIAFLAGYSVELLFSLADALIAGVYSRLVRPVPGQTGSGQTG